MLNLVELLSSQGFEKTALPISRPLVIHAVAGAGKTSLVNNFLASNLSVQVVTVGKLPTSSLTYSENSVIDDNSIRILDEYQSCSSRENFDVLLGDPLQGSSFPILTPHYVKHETHRFGTETCELLKAIGVHVVSNKTDIVDVRGIVGSEPEGCVLTLDKAGKDYLSSFGVASKCPFEVLGETFDTVTVLLTERLSSYPRHALYVAFSRHSRKLILLTPYAFD